MAQNNNNLPRPISDNRVSVDCVVFGFDGERLNVLLVRRTGEEEGKKFHDMKLPGSLIYIDEGLDDAAKRVLAELTGLYNVSMAQFRAFGSKDRTNNPKDVHWLERNFELKIDRIVTIAYIAVLKIDKTVLKALDGTQALWLPVKDVPDLAFDHNLILSEAVDILRRYLTYKPEFFFDLLPKKFTIYQLRKLHETILQHPLDPGNFYKKIATMPYVIPLEEMEQKTSHRAARLYKFDRKVFRKSFVEK